MVDSTRFGVTADLLKTVNSIVSGAKPATISEDVKPLAEAKEEHYYHIFTKPKGKEGKDKSWEYGDTVDSKEDVGHYKDGDAFRNNSRVAVVKRPKAEHPKGNDNVGKYYDSLKQHIKEEVDQVPNHKKKVSHATFGEGVIIPELYENETLDIMFKEGIKNVPYSEIIGLEFTEEYLDEWSFGSLFKKKSDRPAQSNKDRGFDNATHEYARHLAAGDHVAALQHRKNIETKFGKGHAEEMHEKAVKKVADDKVANKHKAFADHYSHVKAKESAAWGDRAKHNATIKSHYDDVARVHGKETADDMKNYAEAKHKLASITSKHDLSD